jgi:phosphoserine phosphatase
MIYYIISSSLVFLLRRNLKKPHAEIDNIILDMDRTLLTTNIGKEALIICYGKEKADYIEHSIMRKAANGNLSLGEGMVMAINHLVDGNFTLKDHDKLIDMCLKGEIIRHNLLNSILNLQQNGKRIILATMSSYDAANSIAGKYGFFGSIGTVEDYNDNGKMTGCSQVICDENKDVNGVRFRTKTYILKEMFANNKLIFEPQRTAIITDDLTDLHVMREVALAIFLKVKEPTKIQKLCYRLKLFDLAIHEDEDLEKIIN